MLGCYPTTEKRNGFEQCETDAHKVVYLNAKVRQQSYIKPNAWFSCEDEWLWLDMNGS